MPAVLPAMVSVVGRTRGTPWKLAGQLEQNQGQVEGQPLSAARANLSYRNQSPETGLNRVVIADQNP